VFGQTGAEYFIFMLALIFYKARSGLQHLNKDLSAFPAGYSERLSFFFFPWIKLDQTSFSGVSQDEHLASI
jgi:hypothetical protein